MTSSSSSKQEPSAQEASAQDNSIANEGDQDCHDTKGCLVEGNTAAGLLRDARRKLRSGNLHVLMGELCSDPESALSRAAPHREIGIANYRSDRSQ